MDSQEEETEQQKDPTPSNKEVELPDIDLNQDGDNNMLTSLEDGLINRVEAEDDPNKRVSNKSLIDVMESTQVIDE